MLNTLKTIYTDHIARTSSIGVIIVFWYGERYYTNYDMLFGNFWPVYAYTYIGVSIIISLLLGVFIAAHIYKIRLFKNPHNKHTATGIFAWIVGFLTTGCASCSISIASMIGLGGLFSWLPGHGIEIKFLSLIILTWATRYTLKHIHSCKTRRSW